MYSTIATRAARTRFEVRHCVGALLIGVWFSTPPGALAQDDHAAQLSDAPGPVQRRATGTATGDPNLEATIYSDVVQTVVDEYREEFESVQDGNALRTPLRALAGRIHDAVAEHLSSDVAKRRGVVQNVRDRFLGEITKLAFSPAAAETLRSLFEEAVDADFHARRQHLWSLIMCWCPREKWTRTLSGCPDACADEQKDMVERWLKRGRTSDEVIELMVAHPKGGEQVRGYLKATGVNLLGYLLPFLFLFGAAAVAVGFVLYGRTVRRDKDESGSATALEGADDAGEAGIEDDRRWGDVIEKELKEMDN